MKTTDISNSKNFFVLPLTRLAMEDDSYDHYKTRKLTQEFKEHIFQSDSTIGFLRNLYDSYQFTNLCRMVSFDQHENSGFYREIRNSYFTGFTKTEDFFKLFTNKLAFKKEFNRYLEEIIVILRSTVADKNMDDFVNLIKKAQKNGSIVILPVCTGEVFYQRIRDQINERLAEEKITNLEENPNVIVVKSFLEHSLDMCQLVDSVIKKYDIDREEVNIFSLNTEITDRLLQTKQATISLVSENNNAWSEESNWVMKKIPATEEVNVDSAAITTVDVISETVPIAYHITTTSPTQVLDPKTKPITDLPVSASAISTVSPLSAPSIDKFADNVTISPTTGTVVETIISSNINLSISSLADSKAEHQKNLTNIDFISKPATSLVSSDMIDLTDTDKFTVTARNDGSVSSSGSFTILSEAEQRDRLTSFTVGKTGNYSYDPIDHKLKKLKSWVDEFKKKHLIEDQEPDMTTTISPSSETNSTSFAFLLSTDKASSMSKTELAIAVEEVCKEIEELKKNLKEKQKDLDESLREKQEIIEEKQRIKEKKMRVFDEIRKTLEEKEKTRKENSKIKEKRQKTIEEQMRIFKQIKKSLEENKKARRENTQIVEEKQKSLEYSLKEKKLDHSNIVNTTKLIKEIEDLINHNKKLMSDAERLENHACELLSDIEKLISDTEKLVETIEKMTKDTEKLKDDTCKLLLDIDKLVSDIACDEVDKTRYFKEMEKSLEEAKKNIEKKEKTLDYILRELDKKINQEINFERKMTLPDTLVSISNESAFVSKTEKPVAPSDVTAEERETAQKEYFEKKLKILKEERKNLEKKLETYEGNLRQANKKPRDSNIVFHKSNIARSKPQNKFKLDDDISDTIASSTPEIKPAAPPAPKATTISKNKQHRSRPNFVYNQSNIMSITTEDKPKINITSPEAVTTLTAKSSILPISKTDSVVPASRNMSNPSKAKQRKSNSSSLPNQITVGSVTADYTPKTDRKKFDTNDKNKKPNLVLAPKVKTAVDSSFVPNLTPEVNNSAILGTKNRKRNSSTLSNTTMSTNFAI